MIATTDSQIVENLKAALAHKKVERDAELERIRAYYQEQIESLQRVLAIFNGSPNGNGHLPTVDMTPVLASVSKERVDAVRQLLRKERYLRQADIAKKLRMNRGSVSAAMRHLAVAHEVEPGTKDGGSQGWRYVGTNGNSPEATEARGNAEQNGNAMVRGATRL